MEDFEIIDLIEPIEWKHYIIRALIGFKVVTLATSNSLEDINKMFIQWERQFDKMVKPLYKQNKGSPVTLFIADTQTNKSLLVRDWLPNSFTN